MFKHLKIIWNYLLLELENPFKKCHIQAIFDSVIKYGYYADDRMLNKPTSHFMCLALVVAANKKKITWAEHNTAKKAIYEYLKPTGVNILEDALKATGLYSHTFQARLKIYQNWANRPKLGVTNG